MTEEMQAGTGGVRRIPRRRLRGQFHSVLPRFIEAGKIMDNLPMVLFVVDGNFRVKYLNRRFAEMFSCANTGTTEVGRLINCQTLAAGGKCTCEPECSLCMLRQALIDCVGTDGAVRDKMIEKKIVREGRTARVSLKLTVSPVKGEDSYICVVDDVTELVDLSEREKQLNRQLLTDLKKAKHIQRDLLPERDGEGRIDYLYRQVNSVGGDFFDIWRIDETHTGAYIADVSGHGLGGGMLTVFLKENFNRRVTKPGLALDELYARFNRFHFSENSYITILAVVYDEARQQLSYSNAGHGVPLLVKEEGGFVRAVTERGTPISNWFKAEEYPSRVTRVAAGSLLLFTTDGVTDMRNPEGLEFGMQPLKESLSGADTPADAVRRVQRRIDGFARSGKDDIAVLVWRV